MEHCKLNGIFKLDRDVVAISGTTFNTIVNYINQQTDVINYLQDRLSELEASVDATDNAVKTNATNIKTIANALEGVYKNEA